MSYLHRAGMKPIESNSKVSMPYPTRYSWFLNEESRAEGMQSRSERWMSKLNFIAEFVVLMSLPTVATTLIS